LHAIASQGPQVQRSLEICDTDRHLRFRRGWQFRTLKRQRVDGDKQDRIPLVLEKGQRLDVIFIKIVADEYQLRMGREEASWDLAQVLEREFFWQGVLETARLGSDRLATGRRREKPN